MNRPQRPEDHLRIAPTRGTGKIARCRVTPAREMLRRLSRQNDASTRPRFAIPSDRWTSLTVGLMLALAAAGLWWLHGHAAAVSLQGHKTLAFLAAVTYTVLTVLILPRRRISPRIGVVLVTTLQALMLAEGTTYPEVSLRWICLSVLTVLPLVAVVLIGRRGAMVSTLVSCLITLIIAAELPGTAEVRTYVATTMTSLVCVPVLVVGVLLGRLEQARAAAQRMANLDPLTGLLNRRGMLERFPRLVDDARSTGQRISITVVDLDHFKRVNDDHGHLIGDQVLAAVANVLATTTRSQDVLWRLGGEEIAWAATHLDPADAAAVAERARAAVADCGVQDWPPVTISLGVATSSVITAEDDAIQLLHSLLATADTALYRAKASGRDRVEMTTPI